MLQEQPQEEVSRKLYGHRIQADLECVEMAWVLCISIIIRQTRFSVHLLQIKCFCLRINLVQNFFFFF